MTSRWMFAPLLFCLACVELTLPPATIAIEGAEEPLAAGEARTYSARVLYLVDPSVTWTVDEPGGGSVDASGRYTAPATPGTYTLRATAKADPEATATRQVEVTPSACGACATPPAATCADAHTRRTFGAGACVQGQCSYPPADTNCPDGCEGGACVAGSCSDDRRNGDETDKDCGGSCPACATGLACTKAEDCTSGICTGHVCVDPSCSDGSRNGDETDKDCGGSCGGCAAGLACAKAGDCASGVCTANVCVAARCGDGIVNQPSEECDDGNASDADACLNDCHARPCTVGIDLATVQAGLDLAACPVVHVPAGTFTESLTIARAVELRGAGADVTSIVAPANSRVVGITSGEVTLRDLTVRGGRATETGAGILIQSHGLVTLSGVVVRDNIASRAGAGVYVLGGRLVVEGGSRITANRVEVPSGATSISAQGAGVFSANAIINLRGGAMVTQNVLNAPSVTDFVGLQGAGLQVNGGALTLDGATVSGNQALLDLGSPGGISSGASGGGISCSSSIVILTGGAAVDDNSVTVLGSGSATRGSGGGISSTVCQVTLTDAFVRNNTVTTETTADGGALFLDLGSSGFSCTRSAITGNKALATSTRSGTTAEGGAIDCSSGSTLSFDRCTLSGNEARATGTSSQLARGGAVHFVTGSATTGTITIRDSTFSANRAVSSNQLCHSYGGAIYAAAASAAPATLSLGATNSTFSGNSVEGGTGCPVQAASGGAIYFQGTSGGSASVALANVTVTGNIAGMAGGVAGTIGVGGGSASMTARNAIIAGNTAPNSPDCSIASGFSAGGPVVLGTDTSCNPGGTNVLRSATPGLGPLQANGGPTQTHALLPGSPAIDASNGACVDLLNAALTADQRGNARSDGRCDAGAYEAP